MRRERSINISSNRLSRWNASLVLSPTASGVRNEHGRGEAVPGKTRSGTPKSPRPDFTLASCMLRAVLPQLVRLPPSRISPSYLLPSSLARNKRMFALSAYRPDQPKTLQFQRELKHLPVPTLEASTERYVHSLRPILLERALKAGKPETSIGAELETRREAAKDFMKPGGLGQTLQARLIGSFCLLCACVMVLMRVKMLIGRVRTTGWTIPFGSRERITLGGFRCRLIPTGGFSWRTIWAFRRR